MAMGIGILAVRSNGGSGDHSFSLLVATPRNPAFDDIFSADNIGWEEELKNTKLMFAPIGSEDEKKRLAFAPESQIKQLQNLLGDNS